jgi:NTE family protein
MKPAAQTLRIGLALGGGGARGWAHIGVLQALAERKISIHAYSGTSIGSLVGGFAAAGKLADLEEVLAGLDLKRIVHLFAEKKLPRAGLLDGRHIVELIRRHLGCPDISALPAPYCAVATDIESGEEIVMRQGDLVTAIRASIAIPGIFTPMKRDGLHLVDGGLVNPLPIRPLKDLGVEKIIAVNLHGDGIAPLNRPLLKHPVKSASPGKSFPVDSSSEKTKIWLEKQKTKVEQAAQETIQRWLAKSSGPGIFNVMANSIDIISSQITKTTLQQYPPDILIQPKVGDIGHMEFFRVEEGVDAGYRAAMAALDAA